MVVADLAVDELEGLPALALLGGQALLDEQFAHPFGHPEGAFGVRVAVGDLHQVLAGTGDRGVLLQVLEQFFLLQRSRVFLEPAATLQGAFQHLAAEDDLPGDAGAIGHVGGHRAAFQQRLDDVAFLGQDGGRTAVVLGQQEQARQQGKQRDRGKRDRQAQLVPADFQPEDLEEFVGGLRIGGLAAAAGAGQAQRRPARGKGIVAHQNVRSGTVITSPGETV